MWHEDFTTFLRSIYIFFPSPPLSAPGVSEDGYADARGNGLH